MFDFCFDFSDALALFLNALQIAAETTASASEGGKGSQRLYE